MKWKTHDHFGAPKNNFSGSLPETGFVITSTHIIFHLQATQLAILTAHANILCQKLEMRPERCGLISDSVVAATICSASPTLTFRNSAFGPHSAAPYTCSV
jgi:hypothetical protein